MYQVYQLGMLKSMMQRLISKRALKVRIEGPLDVTLEHKIVRQLQQSRIDGVLVIINSYGGSLAVASNIASALMSLKSRNIPVYCFAEEYCLNSANLILTAGTRCFAHKLSVLGDLGFAYQNYLLEGKVQLQRISNNPIPLEFLADKYQLTKQQNIDLYLQQLLNQLKEAICTQRQLLIEEQKEEGELSGSMTPQEAQKIGLIDEISSANGFIRQKLGGWKLIEGSQGHKYRAMNFIRSSLQVFKQE